jgi:hypothetical protein
MRANSQPIIDWLFARLVRHTLCRSRPWAAPTGAGSSIGVNIVLNVGAAHGRDSLLELNATASFFKRLFDFFCFVLANAFLDR